MRLRRRDHGGRGVEHMLLDVDLRPWSTSTHTQQVHRDHMWLTTRCARFSCDLWVLLAQWQHMVGSRLCMPPCLASVHIDQIAVHSVSNPRERKMRTNFFAQIFEHPQGSGTSRQNFRDIPDSFRNPRKTNFRGRARTFQPPPLCVEDPHTTGRSPDPKSYSLCSFCLREVQASRSQNQDGSGSCWRCSPQIILPQR